MIQLIRLQYGPVLALSGSGAGSGAVTSSAISAGSGLIGGALGMIGSKRRAWEQYSRQGKLMDRAAAQNMELARYNQELEKQMIEFTSPLAMKQRYKDAGLNPALMYGMGGGGGMTTGGAAAQGVGTPTAPMRESGAGGAGMGMQLAGQMQMMSAQIENIKADTKQKLATVPKTEAETKNLGAEFENIISQAQNNRAKTALTEAQEDYQELLTNLGKDTYETMVAQAENNLKTSENEFQRGVRRNWIEENTKQTAINTLRQNYALLVAQTGVAEIAKKYTQSNIDVNNATIKKIAQDVTNSIIGTQFQSKELQLKNRQQALEKFSAGMKSLYPQIRDGLYHEEAEKMINELEKAFGQ